MSEKCKTILSCWKKAYKNGNSVHTILVEAIDGDFEHDEVFPDEAIADGLDEKDLCDLVIKFCQWVKKQ